MDGNKRTTLKVKLWKFSVLLTVLLFVFITPVFGSWTFPTHNGFGNSTHDFIYFDETRTFSTKYRSGETWYFDNYQFSIQNANVTVTNLFDSFDTPDTMTLEVTGETASSTSTLSINATDAGYDYEPFSVTASGDVTSWTQNWSGEVLTLTTTHDGADPTVYTVDWHHEVSTTSSTTSLTLSPLVFDLSLILPYYIVLPFSSTIPVVVEAQNLAETPANCTFEWKILDARTGETSNYGTFGSLIYGLSTVAFPLDVSTPKIEGSYTFRVTLIEPDEDVQVSGVSRQDFRVYGVVSWLLGPGLFLVVIAVAVVVVVVVGLLVRSDYL